MRPRTLVAAWLPVRAIAPRSATTRKPSTMEGRMTYRHLAVIGVALASLAASPASSAPFNTVLTSAEVDKIMDGRCSISKGHAIVAAPNLKWDPDLVIQKAYSVLRSNMPLAQLQKLTRDAEAKAAGGNKWERDVAEFQVCLLDQKLYYAESRGGLAPK